MGICSSCCRQRDKTGEREPLLPKKKHSALPPPRSDIERLADALGALQVGKLPSQAQIDTLLFRLLRSNVFDVDGKIHGSGPISRHGRQVVQDVHDVLEALRQFGLDKNGDDVLQDLIYQYRKLRETASIQVNHEYLAHIQDSALKTGGKSADIPSTQELSEDATSLAESIRTILRLVLTSSTFRSLLKDILELARDYISYTAGEVADVALEVQVAAEDVERAAQTTDISVEDIKGKAKEIYDDVRDVAAGNGSRSNGVPPSRDPRTVAYDRVQLVFASAHRDPPYTQALRTLLEVIRKYVSITRKAADIISHASPADLPKGRLFYLTVPARRLLRDARILAERLASGHPLANLLHLFAQFSDDVLFSPAEVGYEIRTFFAAVGEWCDYALEDPTYANSSAGMYAFGSLYDTSRRLLRSDSEDQLAMDFRLVVDELRIYIRLVQDDLSNKRLANAVRALDADIRQLGADTMGARSRWRREFTQDILGYLLPRLLRSLRSLPIMPRVEYQDSMLDIALDALLLTSTPLTVTSSLTPDHFSVQNLTELYVDLDSQKTDSVVTTRTRTRVHVDGIRLSAHDVGYYAKYKDWLSYEDEGLLSVDIGTPPTSSSQGSGGLEIGIDLNIPESGEETTDQAFDVVDVRVRLDGLALTIDRSKHWLLNKLLLQPLSGPTLSVVLSSILEGKIREGLEAVARVLGEVRRDVADARRDADGEASVQDYLPSLLSHLSTLFASAPPDPDVVQESHTDATVAGLIHTTVLKPAHGEDSDVDSEDFEEGEETIIAIGGAPQLFPGKAGPHDAEEDRGGVGEVVEEVAEDTRSAMEKAAASTREVVRGAREVREELERSGRRKAVRKKVDSRKRGWHSNAFDL
ncbi:uncharacterized protein SCHCODRAFT_02696539 [Schizophyllum commune H4-8]|uniref:uncharacterized protein n=1 Tax=Schizophyllum commune (strain H4-8 / FGSC 9210) TaxID=578458 RepID=UPI00215F2588|nr:uncharacterized protein SCHCODRAFT_02696539 [Schizophyllum commune H4-8]KAI5897910.1 hypothetical protein SCHCODRAFT_02696539 [Schizophyllum commune H4-8]